MRFRTRIDDLRRKRALETREDISYMDIARATGLAYQTVHRYATKEIVPNYETLAKLARYFGVPIEELIISEDEEAEQGQGVAVATP